MVGVVPRPVVDDHADEQPDDDQGARLWKMPEMNSPNCIQADLEIKWQCTEHQMRPTWTEWECDGMPT